MSITVFRITDEELAKIVKGSALWLALRLLRMAEVHGNLNVYDGTRCDLSEVFLYGYEDHQDDKMPANFFSIQ